MNEGSGGRREALNAGSVDLPIDGRASQPELDFLWDHAAATAASRPSRPRSRQGRRVISRVLRPFDLSVVYLTTDAMPSGGLAYRFGKVGEDVASDMIPTSAS